MLKFYSPWWLLALVLVPLYLYYELKLKSKKRAQLPFSRYSLVHRLAPRRRIWRVIYPILRALTILCLVLALARPRFGKGREDVQGQGVDIMIALDVSGSMLAVDFVPENRLGAARKVAKEFIERREHDRIGLVTFSEYALTRCPLTLDHGALIQILNQVEVNKEASSTAIGMGLAAAIARLRNSSAKSKVIILITDGVNNTGEVDPFTAAEMAKAFDIKIYPVGVGSNGLVDFPVDDPIFGTRYQKVQIEMDMNALNRIAATTGTGQAALATNTEQLKAVLANIDKLEKSTYQIRYYYDYKEIFPVFLWLAFFFLLTELGLKLVLIKILPE
ncbi:MAG TPA: VWA domain-containing protein [Candidatus Cloacimonadota bacterium]|nr:VWA domain-containing protein [Candidatus Cloacimonadota bacterium]